MEKENKYLPVPMETVNCFEVWWPVEGDIYYKGELILHIPLGEIEASNIGRIRSLNYGRIKGNVQVLRQRYKHSGKLDNDWLEVDIFDKTVRSHTIIALAYLGERPEGYEVDHINYKMYDNRIENLRYITKAENCCRHSAEGIQNHKDAIDKLWSDEEFRKKQSETMVLRNQQTDIQEKASIGIQKYWADDMNRKAQSDLLKRLHNDDAFIKNKLAAVTEAKSKQVLQIDKKTGEVIKQWSSMIEASKALGISNKNISQCCLGEKHSAGGYLWAFADTFGTEEYYEKIKTDMEKSKRNTNPKSVIQLDIDENFEIEYESAHEAERQTGISNAHISACCLGKRKTAGGKKWRYKQ